MPPHNEGVQDAQQAVHVLSSGNLLQGQFTPILHKTDGHMHSRTKSTAIAVNSGLYDIVHRKLLYKLPNKWEELGSHVVGVGWKMAIC